MRTSMPILVSPPKALLRWTTSGFTTTGTFCKGSARVAIAFKSAYLTKPNNDVAVTTPYCRIKEALHDAKRRRDMTDNDFREAMGETETDLVAAERELVVIKRQKKVIIDDMDEILPRKSHDSGTSGGDTKAVKPSNPIGLYRLVDHADTRRLLICISLGLWMLLSHDLGRPKSRLDM
ncbi:hypothetical protein V500_06424 [Pseudogymnoascus sp. VKM F-4518 (FW-2643)]|nr:hypothetical protein V500_06424 [Pseudogymnoascus sp. VKM F-4518 (FW-2643)]